MFWFICLWRGCFLNVFLCFSPCSLYFEPRLCVADVTSRGQQLHKLCFSVYRFEFWGNVKISASCAVPARVCAENGLGGGHFLLAAITKQAQQSSSGTLTALPPSPPAVYRPLIPVQRPKKQRPLTLERSEGETRQLILRIRNNRTCLFYQQNFLCAGCDQLTCCSVLLASAWHL